MASSVRPEPFDMQAVRPELCRRKRPAIHDRPVEAMVNGELSLFDPLQRNLLARRFRQGDLFHFLEGREMGEVFEVK